MAGRVLRPRVLRYIYTVDGCRDVLKKNCVFLELQHVGGIVAVTERHYYLTKAQ